MGIRRRKFRPPVFSRLALAWIAVCFVLVAIGAATLMRGDKVGRVALPVDEIEFTAPAPRRFAAAPPPEPRMSEPRMPEMTSVIAGDALAQDEAMPLESALYGGGVVDGLAFVEPDVLLEPELPPRTGDGGGEVIITIAGAAPKPATPVAEASIAASRPARPIPDPAPALLAETRYGPVPKIAADGRRASNFYVQASAPESAQPRVALVVAGLGLNEALTERAIDALPAEISLAFAPYAPNLEFWTRKARLDGHEIIIELPMESYGDDEDTLGAAGLLSTRAPAENLQRMDWLLSRFGGYFAATNYRGAKLSSDAAAMTPLLARLKEAGVAYIDDTGSAAEIPAAHGLPLVTASELILSGDQSAAALQRHLRALEITAKRNGAALGKAYPNAVALEEIASWADALGGKGLAAAPASSILHADGAAR